jgi:hypothetical protein
MPTGGFGAVAYTGTLATTNGDDYTPSCAATDSADVVYSFTLAARTTVTVDLTGAEAAPGLTDTVLSLARSCSAPDTQCNDDVGDVFHSRVSGTFEPGTYYVYVDGYNAAVGDYTLAFNFVAP